ncbi:tetratricopeptide repeat protein [Sanyastnella coralliicola]|uniref:tetratricopeptide repeat protein n=1 Tax=Sanyastnella coralliicola TaxID=3069118 RepID=UPI0027B9D695|nr:tetratricopeptide repeat protein [Longitalea sp. SCSIO 12813]
MRKKKATATPFLIFLAIVIVIVIMADRVARDKSAEPTIVYITDDVINNERNDIWQFEREEFVDATEGLEADSLFVNAVDAYRRSQYNRAEEFFSSLVNKYPEEPSIRNYLGLIYLHTDQTVESKTLFEQALASDSAYVPSLINLALVYSRCENYAAADSVYELVVTHSPANSKAWLNRGIMHCRIEEWAASALALNNAIKYAAGEQKAKANTYRGMVAFNLGDSLAATGYFEEAINLAPSYILPRIYRTLAIAEDEVRLEELDKVIALRPGYAPAYYYRGVVLEDMGRTDDARQSFEKALQLNPADKDLSQLLGSFYINNDLIVRAEEYFDQVYGQDTLAPQQFFYRAKIASRNGELETAISLYEKAIDLSDGNYAEAYLNRGILLKKQGKIDDAIASYQRATEVRASYESAWYNMALAHRSAGNDADAVRCYERAIEINPKAVKARYNLGKIYSDQKNVEKAIETYRALIDVDPDYLKAWYNIGSLYLDQDQPQIARKVYEEMLVRFPNYSKAWFNLGVARAESGANQEAIAAYERAIDLDPNYTSAWKNLGNIYASTGDLDQAILQYRQALDIDNSDAQLRFNLALQYEKKGNFDEAIIHLNKAVRIRRDYLKAIEKWAELAVKAKDKEQELLARTFEVELREESEPYYDLARDMHKADQFQNAIDYYRKAESAGKDGVWIRYWQGKAFYDLGDFASAESEFSRALQVDAEHKFTLYRLTQLLSETNDPRSAEYALRLRSLYPEFANEKGI